MGDEGGDATAEAHGRALLWRLTKRHWRGIVAGGVLGLIWTAGKIAIPRFIGYGVDQGVTQGDHGALVRWSVLIVCVGAVSAGCSGLRRWNALTVARTVEAELRDDVFAHLQGLHFGFHDRAHTGDLMSRANTDLFSIQNLYGMVPISAANIMTVVGAVVILLLTDWQLTVVALAVLPLVHVGSKRFADRLHPSVLGIQQESAQLATVVEEAVSGIRIIKGFGAEQVLADRLHVEADDVYDASMEAATVRSRYLPALEVLPNASLILVLAFGGHRVIDGRLTLGELLGFNLYLVLMIAPLRMMGWLVANYQRAVASGGRVHEILAIEPAILDRPGASSLPSGGGRVTFEGVRFGYHDQQPVLDGFDLTIEPGESVALVGSTGSGKTTVARLLPRFYDTESGSISLDGVDVRDLRLHELRRAVATVFEETFLFSDTIGANIAFVRPDASAADIERAARLAGAHEFILALPDGYATVVGERGFSLSGGQRQRVAIARAVLADPRVLILDDATSAVDPTKEHEIRDALAEVMRGRTTIVIAHRAATIALADRVVLVDGGVVVASGTHDGLLATSPRYREVLAAAAAAETVAVVPDVQPAEVAT